MIPTVAIEDLDLMALENEEMPTLTYLIDFEANRTRGLVDGLEAVKQAVYCILSTERYQYPIYSWNYGVELSQLIGTQIDYALPEIERCITEALLFDERITAVEDFQFETKGSVVHVAFTVQTIYGEIKTETEVSI